ncbi:MAG: AMP-binding protein [Chitinophagaceae bacterium]
MMSLFQEISKNKALRFWDENSGETHSFAELDLPSIPVQARSLAFLYLDNSLHSIKFLLAFLESPHVLALLNPALSAAQKAALELAYLPALIVDNTRQAIPDYDGKPDSEIWLARQPAALEIHSKIRLLLSTSGSTGSPKFVKLSDENLISNATSIATYLPINSQDVAPLNLPISYSYGLSVFTSNALFGGTIACTTKDVLMKEFWEQFSRVGFTSLAGVPFVYEMFQRIGFMKKELPSLRYFTQAGGRLSISLTEKFADFALQKSLRFFVMYGQTEATARMAYVPTEKLLQKIGAIGIPIPGGQLRLEESSSELCYKGPNVFGGYCQSFVDLKTYEQPEWLATGDLARVDEEGYFYVTGRLKRFVKLFGNRINLDELETALSQANINDIRCVGLEDKYLILAGKEESLPAARTFIQEHFKLHPTVIKTLMMTEFPLSTNGKIDYQKISERYVAHTD